MIQFNSRNTYYKKPFGAIKQNTDLFLRIKVTGDRPVSSAFLYLTKDHNGEIIKSEGITPSNLNSHPEGSETESTVFEFSMQIHEAGLYFYHFKANYDDGTSEQTSGSQLTVYSPDFTTPDWLKSGVMYQIFPDRFARSTEYRAPQQNKNHILRDDWHGLPNDKPDENGIILNNDFFGGNLKGVMERIDYLWELGVTVIYFNPIFEAYSNHRYDTADYRKIDPMLGTEEDFIQLCKKAKEKGIRVILDGVFNHTGSDSIYFNKTKRYSEVGAYQSKDSPYFSWYRFINYPEQYDSWWGIDTLPSVNETDSSFLDFIIRSDDSVIKHWLRCGVSGFRLDVADELPDEFLEALRIAVKETLPDGAVIGEVWEDASNKVAYGSRRQYFLGRQLDSVMNYPLKNAVIDYLVYRQDGSALEQTVNSLWENYPEPAFRALMNIMGTHDTPRIFTVLSENSKNEEDTRQRLFLMLLIISFLPGIPCIYYGDEIGMRGDKDPLNRKCFVPEQGDPAILRFFKRMFAFRKKISGLENYEFQPRSSEGSFYSFNRIGHHGRLVIAVNSGSHDYLLNLALNEKEILKDFFISGSVSYERHGVFRINGNSGFVALIQSSESHEFLTKI